MKNESTELTKFGIRIDAVCDYCGGPAGWDTFKSPENRREYNLSGYCQKCQDELGVNPGVIPIRKVQPQGVGFKRKRKGGR